MSLDLQEDRRSQADVAHPVLATPLAGSDACFHRVGNGVNPAPRGVSSLDSRRRLASAVDAAFSSGRLQGCGLFKDEARHLNPVSRADVAPVWTGKNSPLFQQRNDVIRRLHDEGATSDWLAEVFDISITRVSQIVNFGRSRSEITAIRERARIAEMMRIGDACFAMYEAGLVLREIAELTGLGIWRISQALQAHPDYWPRRYVVRIKNPAPVPAWVPDEHAERYQWIAAGNGEEVAASCIRRLKALIAGSR